MGCCGSKQTQAPTSSQAHGMQGNTAATASSGSQQPTAADAAAIAAAAAAAQQKEAEIVRKSSEPVVYLEFTSDGDDVGRVVIRVG